MYRGFLEWRYPKMDGLGKKFPLKWITFGYPYFKNLHTYVYCSRYCYYTMVITFFLIIIMITMSTRFLHADISSFIHLHP